MLQPCIVVLCCSLIYTPMLFIELFPVIEYPLQFMIVLFPWTVMQGPLPFESILPVRLAVSPLTLAAVEHVLQLLHSVTACIMNPSPLPPAYPEKEFTVNHA